MRDVLVTGAAGFIGRRLCGGLRSSGHTVIELSRSQGDICDPTTLQNVAPVSHVFHLAARTFVPDSWTDPLAFHAANVLGTCNVLDYCRTHRARLTFVSAYVYGNPARLPVAETDLPRPNNPYALSKCLAERSAEFYALNMGVDVAVIRPFNIFGPGQDARFLVPRVMAQARTRCPIEVKDLSPRRDYLYVEDLVDVLMRTLNARYRFEVFNVGSGRSLSVREVVTAVQQIYGTNLPVVSANESRPNEIDDVYADIGKAERLLGWVPSTSFNAGLERIAFAEQVS